MSWMSSVDVQDVLDVQDVQDVLLDVGELQKSIIDNFETFNRVTN